MEGGTTTWISASSLIGIVYFVFCVWNWELFSFFVFNQIQLKMEFESFQYRPKIFTSVFHLTLITCFLGLVWTWLFSNLYTSTSFFSLVSLVNIRFLSFSLHWGPGYVSASESITRRSLQEHHPPFTLLQTYATTLRTVRPTTGPGASPGALPQFSSIRRCSGRSTVLPSRFTVSWSCRLC